MKTTLPKENVPASTERVQTNQFIAPDVNIYETPEGYTLRRKCPA